MKTKYLLIGAGISNLTLANYLKDDYIIAEKDSTVGGYCRTTRRNGFVWDYAGHFFHFKTDEFKEKFLNKVPQDEIITQEKCTKILYDKSLIDYPFQTNIHQLEKEEFIDCLYDLFNKEEKDNYDNFLDMLYGKFGKSITEKFLKPYNEKLYAIDLTKLDTDAMGRFFPYANKEQIINNMRNSKDISYNNSFLYPKNGAETFIKILYDNLDKDKIMLNTMIKSIDVDKKIAITDKGETIEYEYLINSSPLNKFLELFDDEKIKSLQKELSYNKVLVFNLGFNKKSKLTQEHWIYIPSKECNYYRIGFYDNILSTDKLSMYIEIGYAKDSIITQEEIDRQLELTVANLREQEIIDDETNLIDHEAIVMDPAYVHIEKNTDAKIKEQFSKFAKNNIYCIGRYGSWTYCSMEDCMLQAKEIFEKIA